MWQVLNHYADAERIPACIGSHRSEILRNAGALLREMRRILDACVASCWVVLYDRLATGWAAVLIIRVRVVLCVISSLAVRHADLPGPVRRCTGAVRG